MQRAQTPLQILRAIASRMPMWRSCALLHLCVWIAAGQPALVPAGVFELGTESSEQDERPAIRVRLSAFSIDRSEVTSAHYDSCVKSGSCTPAHYDNGKCLMWSPPEFRRVMVPAAYRDARLPVVCLSWQQARQYCRWRGGDLPTEAQWEYAALAGTQGMYSWGNTAPSPARCAQPLENKPRATCSSQANAWGLCDMTGNVWEWTRDRYQRDLYAFADSVDPKAPEVGRYCTIRGGGWYSGPAQLRIKNRHWFAPEVGEVSIGFRCVY